MLLSIITVCYNNLTGLVKTYESLKSNFSLFEWIIVDGKSNDDTVNFVENEIRFNTENLIFISEQDKGIYDAMNKGIIRATSEFVLFLNAGDTLDYSISSLLKMKEQFSDINVFSTKKVNQHSQQVKWNGLDESAEMLYKVPIPHQSCVIRKKLFVEIGLYDLNYPVLSDHDFFSKAYCRGYHFKFFKEIVLSVFYLDGVSSRLNKSLSILSELGKLQRKNFGRGLPFNIRLRYYYKYALSFFPFSGRFMTLSRNIFFRRYQ